MKQYKIQIGVINETGHCNYHLVAESYDLDYIKDKYMRVVIYEKAFVDRWDLKENEHLEIILRDEQYNIMNLVVL